MKAQCVLGRRLRGGVGAGLVLMLLLAAAAAARPAQAADDGREGQGNTAVPPRRIVSLLPEVTGILYALGAGDLVVGHTHHEVFPGEGSGKIVGGFFAPVIEAIEERQPDLIILSDLHAGVRRHFAGRVPLMHLAPASLAGIRDNIMALGRLTGREEAAARLVERQRETLALIGQKIARIPASARLRTIRFMGMTGEGLITPGDDSFQQDFIRAAGGVAPAFGGSGGAITISREEWQRFNPEVAYGCGDREAIRAALDQPGWREVEAVRNGRIHVFPCDLTCRAGVQADDFVAQLAATLYQEEFSDRAQQVRPDRVISSRPLDLPLEYVAGARVFGSTIRDFEQKSLVVDLAAPMRVLSTLEGMQAGIRTVGNHYFPPPTWGLGQHGGLAVLRERTFAVLGRAPAATSMLFTGADMDNLVVRQETYREMTVYALVTAGVQSNAMRMGKDSGDYYEPGTINIVLLSNMQLSPRAMARALTSATEAKSAALNDLDIRSTYTPQVHQATGTGTDNILVVEGRGRPLDNAGGHTKLGELIARAVHAAVQEAVARQNGLTAGRSVFARLAERKVSLADLLPNRLEECALSRGEVVAAVEQALLAPLYADFLAASLAVSDAAQSGLIQDLRAYGMWGRTIMASLAGGREREWRHYLAPGRVPPVVALGLEALVNGVCAGKDE